MPTTLFSIQGVVSLREDVFNIVLMHRSIKHSEMKNAKCESEEFGKLASFLIT